MSTVFFQPTPTTVAPKAPPGTVQLRLRREISQRQATHQVLERLEVLGIHLGTGPPKWLMYRGLLWLYGI